MQSKSESKATEVNKPGPWSYTKTKVHGFTGFKVTISKTLCCWVRREEVARLIAASPAMYQFISTLPLGQLTPEQADAVIAILNQVEGK